MTEYPGTFQHQALLQAIVEYYRHDPRVLAVVVFGSLGRGNWDEWSDIDLDVVLADGVLVDVAGELRGLGSALAPLGECIALIIPDGEDAGDVVLESLMQLSVRYHSLAETKPHIVSSMRVLEGRLDPDSIAVAGKANYTTSEMPLEQLLDACVRYAAVAHVYLQREKTWLTVEVLHRMRGLLMQVFTRAHGGGRSPQAFEAQADRWLQSRLATTLPQASLASLRFSLLAMIDILEDDLEALSAGQLQLTDAQRLVLDRVCQAISGCGLSPTADAVDGLPGAS